MGQNRAFDSKFNTLVFFIVKQPANKKKKHEKLTLNSKKIVIKLINIDYTLPIGKF
jgi:hypothetical protein